MQRRKIHFNKLMIGIFYFTATASMLLTATKSSRNVAIEKKDKKSSLTLILTRILQSISFTSRETDKNVHAHVS